ncbi:selenoprotein BthD [Drosophila tropicalis]|uniref:selenoprotein BthD n=1 Tax=Drosophila tropicalis TaxID=46794 RepID=UPI0035AC1F53
MPPKRAKKPAPRSGSKPSNANSIPPASTNEGLDPGKPVLYIEHCRSCHVFGRRATELHATLQERGLKQLQLQLNALDRPPRRGAFELHLALRPTAEATEQQALWSGLKRTPRAQKWPDMDVLYEQIVQALNKDQNQDQKEESKKKKEAKATATPKTPKKRKADATDNLEPRSTRSSSAKRSKKSSPKYK